MLVDDYYAFFFSFFCYSILETKDGSLQRMTFTVFIWCLQVHFLQYLNSLYHDDYPLALENLHRYFDYRYLAILFSYMHLSSKLFFFVGENFSNHLLYSYESSVNLS